MFGRLKNWLSRRQKRDRHFERFIEVLRKSQLCTDQQIGELLNKFDAESKDTAKHDALNQFCRFLIDASAVTAWQCEKLKMAKWKGFYLDDYVLLEQVGKDYTTVTYRARDIRDGLNVCLVITPTNLAPYIQYRVEQSLGK